MSLDRKLAVESIGTFFLVFTVGMRPTPRQGRGRWLRWPSAPWVYLIATFLGGAVAAGVFLHLQGPEAAAA